jgi:hypothetical protein
MPVGVKVDLVRLPDAPRPKAKRQTIKPRGSMFCYRQRQKVLAAEGR